LIVEIETGHMKKTFLLLVAIMGIATGMRAQKLYFPRAVPVDSITLPGRISKLAGQLIVLYREDDRKTYLDNLFRLQILAGNYPQAISTIDSIRLISKGSDPGSAKFLYIQYELYAKAIMEQDHTSQPFEHALTRLFNELFGRLDDLTAEHIQTAFLIRSGIPALQSAFNNSLAGIKGIDSLSEAQALDLCKRFYAWQVYKIIEPLSVKLLKEEDARRYIIEDSVMIKTRNGATISAVVVRKRNIAEPKPVILQFTIYTGAIMPLCKDAAANGYVGMLAFTRGKRYSPDKIVPYEHDGEDCEDVIDWISKQPWCNGKVAMYGGSYGGFTQWAATKHLPAALKTIVPSASVAPGLDVPMMNNVFESFVFPWTYYVSNNRYLDYTDYNNNARWDSLYASWYASGKPYRSLDSLTGRGRNSIFQQWIAHPAYDYYWQHMIPYKEDFSGITIPVLSTTGYYDGGQVGAMYYFREHYKYNSHANHYLVIGPYGHYGSQGFLGAMPESDLEGYQIDPVAGISIHDIIFQWFDYILREGRKPALLMDRINYEVMGANAWKHCPSLADMNNDTLKFYMNSQLLNEHYLLDLHKPMQLDSAAQKVDFSDRKTINNYDHTNKIIVDSLDASNGLTFISEPLQQSVEFSGNFTGTLRFSINKKDMDYSVNVYELMTSGKYFFLTYFMGRASYAGDVSARKLLIPGKPQSISFTNSYMTSKKIEKGSRIVVVLNINKSPFEQINFGTGKDVSAETIHDSKTPLKIEWYNSSFIMIPVWK
jgi:uncharacterized protein